MTRMDIDLDGVPESLIRLANPADRCPCGRNPLFGDGYTLYCHECVPPQLLRVVFRALRAAVLATPDGDAPRLR